MKCIRQKIKYQDTHNLRDEDSNIPTTPALENGYALICLHTDQLLEGLPKEIIFVKSLNAPGTPAGNCLNQLIPE